jgi:hypothetical protein
MHWALWRQHRLLTTNCTSIYDIIRTSRCNTPEHCCCQHLLSRDLRLDHWLSGTLYIMSLGHAHAHCHVTRQGHCNAGGTRPEQEEGQDISEHYVAVAVTTGC